MEDVLGSVDFITLLQPHTLRLLRLRFIALLRWRAVSAAAVRELDHVGVHRHHAGGIARVHSVLVSMYEKLAADGRHDEQLLAQISRELFASVVAELACQLYCRMRPDVVATWEDNGHHTGRGHRGDANIIMRADGPQGPPSAAADGDTAPPSAAPRTKRSQSVVVFNLDDVDEVLDDAMAASLLAASTKAGPNKSDPAGRPSHTSLTASPPQAPASLPLDQVISYSDLPSLVDEHDREMHAAMLASVASGVATCPMLFLPEFYSPDAESTTANIIALDAILKGKGAKSEAHLSRGDATHAPSAIGAFSAPADTTPLDLEPSITDGLATGLASLGTNASHRRASLVSLGSGGESAEASSTSAWIAMPPTSVTNIATHTTASDGIVAAARSGGFDQQGQFWWVTPTGARIRAKTLATDLNAFRPALFFPFAHAFPGVAERLGFADADDATVNAEYTWLSKPPVVAAPDASRTAHHLDALRLTQLFVPSQARAVASAGASSTTLLDPGSIALQALTEDACSMYGRVYRAAETLFHAIDIDSCDFLSWTALTDYLVEINAARISDRQSAAKRQALTDHAGGGSATKGRAAVATGGGSVAQATTTATVEDPAASGDALGSPSSAGGSGAETAQYIADTRAAFPQFARSVIPIEHRPHLAVLAGEFRCTVVDGLSLSTPKMNLNLGNVRCATVASIDPRDVRFIVDVVKDSQRGGGEGISRPPFVDEETWQRLSGFLTRPHGQPNVIEMGKNSAPQIIPSLDLLQHRGLSRVEIERQRHNLVLISDDMQLHIYTLSEVSLTPVPAASGAPHRPTSSKDANRNGGKAQRGGAPISNDSAVPTGYSVNFSTPRKVYRCGTMPTAMTSDGGAFIAVGDRQGRVIVYDTVSLVRPTGDLQSATMGTFVPHSERVTTLRIVATQSNTSHIFSTGMDGYIVTTDLHTLTPVRRFLADAGGVRHAIYSPRHSLFVVQSVDRVTKVFISNHMDHALTLFDGQHPHLSQIVAIAIMEQHGQIITVDSNGLMKAWACDRLRCICTSTLVASSAAFIQFRQGQHGGDAAGRESQQRGDDPSSQPADDFSSGSSRDATKSGGHMLGSRVRTSSSITAKKLDAVDQRTSLAIQNYDTSTAPVQTLVALDAHGRVLAMGHNNAIATDFSASKQAAKAHRDAIRALHVNDQANVVVSMAANELRVWSWTAGVLSYVVPIVAAEHGDALCVDTDIAGEKCIVGTTTGHVLVLRLSTGRMLKVFPPSVVPLGRLNPLDGKPPTAPPSATDRHPTVGRLRNIAAVVRGLLSTMWHPRDIAGAAGTASSTSMPGQDSLATTSGERTPGGSASLSPARINRAVHQAQVDRALRQFMKSMSGEDAAAQARWLDANAPPSYSTLTVSYESGPRWIVCLCSDNVLRVFSDRGASRVAIKELRVAEAAGGTLCSAMHAAARLAAFGASDGRMLFISSTSVTGKLVHEIPCPVDPLCVCYCGNYPLVAVALSDGNIQLFHVRPPRGFDSAGGMGEPRDATTTTASAQTGANVRTPRQLEPVTVIAHWAVATSLAYSAAYARLVVGDASGTLAAYDLSLMVFALNLTPVRSSLSDGVAGNANGGVFDNDASSSFAAMPTNLTSFSARRTGPTPPPPPSAPASSSALTKDAIAFRRDSLLQQRSLIGLPPPRPSSLAFANSSGLRSQPLEAAPESTFACLPHQRGNNRDAAAVSPTSTSMPRPSRHQIVPLVAVYEGDALHHALHRIQVAKHGLAFAANLTAVGAVTSLCATSGFLHVAGALPSPFEGAQHAARRSAMCDEEASAGDGHRLHPATTPSSADCAWLLVGFASGLLIAFDVASLTPLCEFVFSVPQAVPTDLANYEWQGDEHVGPYAPLSSRSVNYSSSFFGGRLTTSTLSAMFVRGAADSQRGAHALAGTATAHPSGNMPPSSHQASGEGRFEILCRMLGAAYAARHESIHQRYIVGRVSSLIAEKHVRLIEQRQAQQHNESDLLRRFDVITLATVPAARPGSGGSLRPVPASSRLGSVPDKTPDVFELTTAFSQPPAQSPADAVDVPLWRAFEAVAEDLCPADHGQTRRRLERSSSVALRRGGLSSITADPNDEKESVATATRADGAATFVPKGGAKNVVTVHVGSLNHPVATNSAAGASSSASTMTVIQKHSETSPPSSSPRHASTVGAEPLRPAAANNVVVPTTGPSLNNAALSSQTVSVDDALKRQHTAPPEDKTRTPADEKWGRQTSSIAQGAAAAPPPTASPPPGVVTAEVPPRVVIASLDGTAARVAPPPLPPTGTAVPMRVAPHPDDDLTLLRILKRRGGGDAPTTSTGSAALRSSRAVGEGNTDKAVANDAGIAMAASTSGEQQQRCDTTVPVTPAAPTRSTDAVAVEIAATAVRPVGWKRSHSHSTVSMPRPCDEQAGATNQMGGDTQSARPPPNHRVDEKPERRRGASVIGIAPPTPTPDDSFGDGAARPPRVDHHSDSVRGELIRPTRPAKLRVGLPKGAAGIPSGGGHTATVPPGDVDLAATQLATPLDIRAAIMQPRNAPLVVVPGHNPITGSHTAADRSASVEGVRHRVFGPSHPMNIAAVPPRGAAAFQRPRSGGPVNRRPMDDEVDGRPTVVGAVPARFAKQGALM